MGTSEITVSADAPRADRATEAELLMVRETAAQVFGSGSVGLAGLGEMGWLGLLSAAALGGSGWLPVEAAVVAGEAGRARDATGWASATIGAGVVAATSDEDQRGTWLAGALDGSRPVRWIRVLVSGVEREGGALAISGTAPHVVLGEGTAALVLEADGQVVLVEVEQEGVHVVADPTELDTRDGVMRIELRSARATALPVPALDELRSAALVLGASSAAGALGPAVQRLAAYLSDRIAFGAPIASFQAVQHRIVDLYVLQRRIEAVIDRAARRLEVLDPTALRLACIAHAYVADRVVPALDECIQLSGGIGFVWEYPLHHEMRAALTDAQQFGTARSSRSQLAEIEGW